jgi:outer membrane lipoprotein-sorting protein
MNNERIEETLKNIGNEDVPAEVHKIAQEVSNDFGKTLTQLRQPKYYVLGDYIMKNRLTKLAVAAAVIIVVIFAGLPFLGKKAPGIALADVLAKVEQAQTYIYKMKMTMTGMPNMPAGKQEIEGVTTISHEYGMKVEMDIIDPNTGKKTTQQMYMLPAKKIGYVIMPEMKKYTRMEFNEDLLARVKKQNNDPREMIKQILNSQYTELGRSIIDGKEVEGFHTTDPAMIGGLTGTAGVNYTLWVDTKSWLPVRADMEIKINEQMEMQGVIYDFQWDIPANASDFEPVIPQDFTGFPTEGMKMPEMNEQAAIEGLRFLVELFGQYPKKIDYINLMQELGKLKDIKTKTPAVEKLLQIQKGKEAGTDEEKANIVLEIMRPIQSLGLFYTTLVQDKKEPVYYGESVGPNDGDKILLQWKVSEGQYRVIYGNLTTADITAEQLTELEKSIPK